MNVRIQIDKSKLESIARKVDRFFGPNNRFHLRWHELSKDEYKKSCGVDGAWFVEDREDLDRLGLPNIVAQSDSPEEAIAITMLYHPTVFAANLDDLHLVKA